MFGRVLTVLSLFILSNAAMAETTALLQVEAEGRAGVDRHRLILSNSMPDERDVMLGLSCRIDDQTLGAVIDFGVGPVWDIEGEEVRFEVDERNLAPHRLATNEEFLVLGGASAVRVFRPVLKARHVAFRVEDDLTARFDLASVAGRVKRFQSLCALE